MPVYDFRCQRCGHTFDLSYRSIAAYEAATPTCPRCQGDDLARIIKRVALGGGTTEHDYRRMSSDQMLRVLESGNARDVEAMYKQVGAGADPRRAPRNAPPKPGDGD